ncbi:Acg family FMN-binding oxidoreductase [Streptomyces sp. enrichment culture]|uniref:Acg family FMN-binding oxidoreductase n=1 Tax=Streptomyces sp. enrichment culture TaxID=1795815 RepID=UPI003F558B83
MQTREVDATAVQTLLAAAVAAPSVHNTQPWRFGVDTASRTLQVRADRERWLMAADPERRAQHLSVGAAVLNLRVTAAHLGWTPVVTLLPPGDDPGLLATVRLSEPQQSQQPTTGERQWLGRLYEAVERRHTSRMPFTGRPVPDHVVAELTDAARAEGAHLDVPGIVATRALLRLTGAAEARNAASAERTAESRAWVTAPGAGAEYGVPVTALGPQDLSERLPMRDFAAPLPALGRPAVRFERHVQVALLWTSHDRRQDWLRAGQALQRVLLTATAHGVRTSMLHQAMEWPDLRAAMSGSRRRHHPQLLIRFGYGPEGGRTPRAAPGTPGPPPGDPPAAERDSRPMPPGRRTTRQ